VGRVSDLVAQASQPDTVEAISSPSDSLSVDLSVGIVVPVYNEAAILASSLTYLRQMARDCPIVVVDGGSDDGSADIARRIVRTEVSPVANRGAQMNLGAHCLAEESPVDVLLFLHVDTRLPQNFLSHIRAVLSPRQEVKGGCFQMQFDRRSPWLWFYAWCTRFRGRYLHFGDQAFFLRREVFEALEGYRELPLMEDVDLLVRLRRQEQGGQEGFVVLPASVLSSARRFLRFGAVRQQLLNLVLVVLYELGVSPHRLRRWYPPVR